MVRLSAIVPATNGAPTLDACVDAIRAADDGPDELVVVTDRTLVGPAAARNAGARAATGDVLVFVDADVIVHPDAFRRIRGTFAALNASFYALLFRRRGGAQAATGIVLHALHHLTAAASVPVGIAAHTLS